MKKAAAGDPEQQSGNYLAIKVEGDADRVRVKIDPSYAGLDRKSTRLNSSHSV